MAADRQRGRARVYWVVMERHRSSLGFLTTVALCSAGALGLALLIRSGALQPETGGLEPGRESPRITAAGWLNGEPPTAAGRRGQVMLVHAWFTNCPACHQAAPRLVRLHEHFRDRGVVFIGLTFEDGNMLPYVEQFLAHYGITWPNGYGAGSTLSALEARYFPAMWIIDRQGRIVWNSDSESSIVQAIEQALREDERSG